MLNAGTQKMLLSAILAEVLKLNRVTRGGGEEEVVVSYHGLKNINYHEWVGGGDSKNSLRTSSSLSFIFLSKRRKHSNYKSR